MGITPAQEYTAMLYMLFCGVICGVLYDMVRISRVLARLADYTRAGKQWEKIRFPLIGAAQRERTVPVSRVFKNIALALGDILFFIASGCVFSIFLAHYASGIFRWFFLGSTAVGFLLYYFTVGRAVMFASEVIASVVRTVFRYGIWLVLLPMKLCKRAVIAACGVLHRRVLVPIWQAHVQRARVRYTMKIKRELPTAVSLSIERGD